MLLTDAEWQLLAPQFRLQLATRQIIVAEIHKVQTSCGFSVPYYSYEGERTQAQQWAEKKGVEGLETYKLQKNRISMDGFPTPLSRWLTLVLQIIDYYQIVVF